MKSQRDQKAADAYWKYLDENSRIVSGWPKWLKGERSSPPQPQANQEPKEELQCEAKKTAS